MLTTNFSVGLSICTGFLGILIFLYLYDPEVFFIRILGRARRLKFFVRDWFSKAGKAEREKHRKLYMETQFCETAITRYVNKYNLSELQDDKTLQDMLVLYKELLNMETKPNSELSVEQIQDIRNKVEDLYFPDMDPYYVMEEAV